MHLNVITSARLCVKVSFKDPAGLLAPPKATMKYNNNQRAPLLDIVMVFH